MTYIKSSRVPKQNSRHVVWAEPVTISKDFLSSHSNIKDKSIVKACKANIPYVYVGENTDIALKLEGALRSWAEYNISP